MACLVIIGASGHGKVVADTACLLGYEDIIFLDDNTNVCECAGFPVVGTVKDATHYLADFEFVVAIGNAKARERIQSGLVRMGAQIATIISPRAYIGRQVKIGKGCVFMPGSVVNSGTSIGDGCIVNTGATIDHDCKISEYVHIAVGVHLAGNVEIEHSSWIGAGAIVINDINICSDCMIGAGAVVIRDIIETGTYVGVPAAKVS